MAAGGFSTLFMILITVFIPPLGVFMLGGCGVDFWINMLLALVGYFPAHVHAIYLEYVYIDRRGRDPLTRASLQRAPFVFSDRIQNGGHRRTSAGRTHGTDVDPNETTNNSTAMKMQFVCIIFFKMQM